MMDNNTMKKYECSNCNSKKTFSINTYKRYWIICEDCGCGYSKDKKRYPLSLLPYKSLKKDSSIDYTSIYDYFVEDIHIKYSIDTALEFIRNYIRPFGIDLFGKKVIDISGGNGFFVNELKKMGAEVTLTEINDKTITFAKDTFDFDVYKYDLNKDNLGQIVKKKYDIVLLRAAIMFCEDLPSLIDDIKSIMNKDALLFVHQSVLPTLGTILRIQCDEFSYYVLYQPETVSSLIEKKGFDTVHKEIEIDSSMYAYNHDEVRHLRMLHFIYEVPALRKIPYKTPFCFNARDRRRANMIFKMKR